MIHHLLPTFDNILIELEIETDQKTKGGLYLPDSAKETRPNVGWVRFLGEEVPEEKLRYRIGDKVLFGKYMGMELLINEENRYVLLHYHDVQAVIDKEI